MPTAFETYHAMLVQMNQEETAAAEARLINDGTYITVLESFEKLSADRLPSATVEGYNLTFKVDDNGTDKRMWVTVYFTPVQGAKGLVLPSKLGAQLAQALEMQETEDFADLLNRAKGTPLKQRIGKKAASNGYKAKNTTWAISKV